MEPEEIKIRPEVYRFATEMEKTLRKHDNTKGGWDEAGFDWLLHRISEELKEANFEYNQKFGTIAKTAEELVDVANFCMMFYDNAHRGERVDKE